LVNSDQGGRGDGVKIMVHRGYAYIGHGYSNGITVLDVRDPKNPRPVAFLPCPPDTRALHLQTHDELLLAVNGPSMWTMQVDAQAYYSGSPADLLKGRDLQPTSSCSSAISRSCSSPSSWRSGAVRRANQAFERSA
jgi:hypothetical protein